MRSTTSIHRAVIPHCNIAAVDKPMVMLFLILEPLHRQDAPPLPGEVTADAAFAKQQLLKGATPVPGSFIHMQCHCNVCVPMRVDVQGFRPNTDLRRVFTRNAGLSFSVHEGISGPYETDIPYEHATLYRKYMKFRFPDLPDTPHTDHEASSFLLDFERMPGMNAQHMDMRGEHGKLLASAIFHTAQDFAYATAFFYEPAARAKTPGITLIMKIIEHLQERGFEHLYMASITRKPSAYSWKDKFLPMDCLIDGQWTRIENKAQFRLLRVDRTKAYPAPRQI